MIMEDKNANDGERLQWRRLRRRKKKG